MFTGSKEMHNNTLHFVMIESFNVQTFHPSPFIVKTVARCTILPSVSFFLFYKIGNLTETWFVYW